jgi:alpha-beta hydrolase superfamily lysophospholipase
MTSPSLTVTALDGSSAGVATSVPLPGPQWFGSPERPLFGWVHEPVGRGPSGAVVLCPPLFGEKSAVHATYRALATDLSARGHWVVRFDYEGTGDSSGPTAGPGRPVAWLTSIDRAVALARRYTDGPVALVGMRMGALLAAMAAGRGAGADALVLWDPCTSGRTFLRRHQAIQAMRFPPAAGWRGVEVPGYSLDEAVAGEVTALRLPRDLPVGRVLVVARPGDRRPAVRCAGQADGLELRRSEPGEQEALLEAGHLSRTPPAATSGYVADWLDRTLRRVAAGRAGGERSSAVPLADASSAVPLADASSAVPLADASSVVLPVDGAPGATVVERVRWFGPVGLFGIETEAAGRIDATDGAGDPSGSGGQAMAGSGDLPVVVLLSSGTDTHVGPSRLWVRLARQWAAGGAVRCVRVDLSGWGESPAHPGRDRCVLRPVEAFDDVGEILSAIGRPERVVLVGLCSGAYQALESALEVPPAAVLAVNPLLRFTPPELVETGSVSPRRRMCDPKQPWVHSVRSRLPRPAVRVVVSVRSAASRLRFAGRVEDALGSLVAAGVHVYCMCGEDDARPLLQVRRRVLTAWRASGQVRVDVVPGLDHALLPRDQREEACDRLTGALRRIVAELSAGTLADSAGSGGPSAARQP